MGGGGCGIMPGGPCDGGIPGGIPWCGVGRRGRGGGNYETNINTSIHVFIMLQDHPIATKIFYNANFQVLYPYKSYH